MIFVCLGVVLATTFLHWWLADYDLPAPFFVEGKFDIWCIHHDEKLVVPDARWLHVRSSGSARLNDYRPWPVFAAFGLAGPVFPAIGFRVFGLTNRGLRLPALCIGLVSNGLAVCFAMEVLPAWAALFVTVVLCANYRFFILRHHYILENILVAAMLGLLWWHSAAPQLLWEHLAWVAFAVGVCGWIKPHFPVILLLLLGSLMFVSGAPWSAWLQLALGGAGGVVFFEGLQCLVLWRMGIAHMRWDNMRDTLRIHTGKPHTYLQKHFKPVGRDIFLRFPALLIDWLCGWSLRALPPRNKWVCAAGGIFWALLTVAALAGPPGMAGLLIFSGLVLALSMPFFYYPKRACHLLAPLTVCVVFAIQYLAGSLPPLVWAVLMGLYVWSQYPAFRACFRQRSDGVRRRCRQLQALLPEGATLRMHCYAFRFSWQLEGVRIISGDDQVVNNEMLLGDIAPDATEYLMLSGLPSQQLDALSSKHALLGVFESAAAESDFPMRFHLFKSQGSPRQVQAVV